MPEMLLINPRRRRRAASAKRRTVKRRRNPTPAFAAVRRRRRRNPAVSLARRRTRRRSNPIARRARRVGARRRRNPISFGGMGFYTGLLKDAAIGAAGSLAMDYLMEQVNPMLPVSLQPAAANISANDAVKAVLTAFLGKSLSGATRGMSVQAARGSLTVQLAAIMNTFAPAAGNVGFYSPARIVQGTNRVGPIRSGVNGVRAYMQPGKTVLLNGVDAYTQPGRTPLLSGIRGRSAQQREGVSTYY